MTGIMVRALRQIRTGVFVATAGFCLAFCALALIDLGLLSDLVDAGSSWVGQVFGLYWQILLPTIFFVGLAIALSPAILRCEV